MRTEYFLNYCPLIRRGSFLLEDKASCIIHHCSTMAAGKWYILLALPFLLLSLSASHYSEYYARGVQSYFDDNDWKTAAETLQKSLEDYDLMNKARLTCYTKCDKEPVSIPPDYIQDDRLHFYHTIIQAATCRRNCMKQLVGDRSLSYSSKIEEAISSGEIYNYLQYSFYQVRRN